MNRSKAFSAIEVTIVMTVVIILSVAVIVAIGNQIKAIRLANASDKLVSDLTYAQYMANGTSQWYGVSLEANPGNIYVVFVTTGTLDTVVPDPADQTDLDLVNVNATYGVQISSVTVEGGGKKIEFRPDGTPFTDKTVANPATQECVITLSNGSATRTVRVTPNTGRIYEQ